MHESRREYLTHHRSARLGRARPFFIVGDQTSSLPGWQEGAISSALSAVSRLARPDLMLPFLSALPDTKLMVEGLVVDIPRKRSACKKLGIRPKDFCAEWRSFASLRI